MASEQIVVIVVCVVALLIVLALAKKAVKVVLMAVILVAGGIFFGLFSKQDVMNTASMIKEKGAQAYQSFADASERIKINSENISVLADGDTWLDLNSVSNFSISGNTVTLEVGGKTYQITDKTVAKMMSSIAGH